MLDLDSFSESDTAATQVRYVLTLYVCKSVFSWLIPLGYYYFHT